MAQVIIFTGSSRTDPKKFSDKTDQVTFLMNRPLGAYQIASILRDNGYTVQVIDRYHWMVRNKGAEFYRDVIKKYITKDTLWVGWSNTFFEGKPKKDDKIKNVGYITEAIDAIGMEERGMDAMNRFRQATNPDMKFICGGAKTWRWSQQGLTFFDFYFEGYGDVMMLDFTNWLAGKGKKPPSRILDTGAEVVNYDRRGDQFDFINHTHKWHKSDHIEPGEALPIEISRGCIFRCAYCSFPLNGKKKLDFIREPEPLREEFIKNYEEFGITKYYYSDDTHNDSVEKLEYLYNEIYSKLPFKIEFATYLRLDLLAAHPQTIPLLKESGLVGTFFGIESFNNEANKAVGKGAKEEKIYENLWKCKEVWKDQVHIHSGLIIGLPNDDEESVMDWGMRAVAKDSPLDWSSITELHLFPNYGKDKHWLNKMELNPDLYGYTFDKDGINWTNNKGLTKIRSQQISEILKNEMDKNKWGNREHPKSWYSFAHAANLKMELEDYLDTSQKDIILRRDSLLDQYYNKLKNGDPQ